MHTINCHCPECDNDEIAIFTCSQWNKKTQSLELDWVHHIHCSVCNKDYDNYKVQENQGDLPMHTYKVSLRTIIYTDHYVEASSDDDAYDEARNDLSADIADVQCYDEPELIGLEITEHDPDLED